MKTEASNHIQVWICLSLLIRHKNQKPMNIHASILTSALNFKLCYRDNYHHSFQIYCRLPLFVTLETILKKYFDELIFLLKSKFEFCHLFCQMAHKIERKCAMFYKVAKNISYPLFKALKLFHITCHHQNYDQWYS